MSKTFKNPSADPTTNPHVMAADDDRIGGEKGYHRSRWTRAIELAKANQDNEWRIDTNYDDISSLEHKYAKEFAIAEKRMEERKQTGGWKDTFRMRVSYDHENDPVYKEWLADKKRAKEILHIHTIDEWLDDPVILCKHSCKVSTAVGGLQGAYRAHALWKSIDQQYAKLNGVTFRALLVQEVSMGILRGVGMGLAFGCGCMLGDGAHRVFHSLAVSHSVARERRQWGAIPTATTIGALCSSVVAGFWMRDLLTFRGQLMLHSAVGSVGLMAGMAAGYFVYKPFAEAYPEEYDSPWWRPWNERTFHSHGPPGIRGRFV